ncbi:hypothetical protein DFH09DRAFT_1328188 [Mycena vulgaris]|nr:hypothetical protein DFH09DRAFT_1328188 [Mycena vulgaris]
MSGEVYCNVPRYDDPGVTVDLKAKLYLVTGTTVEFPGAYTSWPSADAMYKKSPGSTLKGYNFSEQARMHAGCERGEHHHTAAVHTPTSPAATPSLARPTPSSKARRAPRPVVIDSRSPSLTSTAFTPSAPITGSPFSSDSVVLPAGRRAYAVRSNGVGQIFDEYSAARDHYHGLQHLGEQPALFVGSSLTAAVCFVERDASGSLPLDMDQRRVWIREEKQARALMLMARDGASTAPSPSDEGEESDLSDSQ